MGACFLFSLARIQNFQIYKEGVVKTFQGALLFLFIFSLTFNLSVAEETLLGKVIESGKVTAFDEEHLLDENSVPIFCETSAVVFDGEKIIFGTENPLPGKERSSIFSFPLVKGQGFDVNSRSYCTAQPFLEARRYEDFTITPDKKTILATTGFDRFSEEENLDGYNTLLAWPTGSENLVTIVDLHNRDNINSSLGLRDKIRKAMISEEYPEGPTHFKVEGLAAIPNNRLLFGIREIGDNHLDYKSVIKILSVGYKGEGVSFELDGEFEEIYDSTAVVQEVIGREVALSGLEYDKFNDRLLILTSYEEVNGNEVDGDMGIGGFLLYLTMDGLEAKSAPSLVHDAENRPLSFAHKPEGIAVLDSSILLVVHDDDGVLGREIIDDTANQFSRRANEGYCDVVRLNKVEVREEINLQEEMVEVEAAAGLLEETVEVEAQADPQAEMVEVEAQADSQEEMVEVEAQADPQAEMVEVEAQADPQAEMAEVEAQADPQAEMVEVEAQADPQAEMAEVEAQADPQAEMVEVEAQADPQAEMVEVEAQADSQAEMVEVEAQADPQEEVVEVEAQADLQADMVEAAADFLEETVEVEVQKEAAEVEIEVNMEEATVEVEMEVEFQEKTAEAEESIGSEETVADEIDAEDETVDAEEETEIETEEATEFSDEFVMKSFSFFGGVTPTDEANR
ncbi:MAG: hypothetical protein ACI9S8_002871 [Chlamydiales bacterium]|jgi:hypothetical protein